MARRRKRPVNPDAQRALDRMKHEVAQELGYIQGGGGGGPNDRENQLRMTLDRMKREVADELGISDKVKTVGWGEVTSRECGKVGGRLGGRLGGQMVKRMVEFAEAQMTPESIRR